MITPATIYFVGILDNINNVFFVFVIVSLALAGGLSLIILNENDEDITKFCCRWLKWAVFGFVLSVFLHAFTPTTKLAAAMYVIPTIANNENVKELGGDTMVLLKKLTKQWVSDLDKDEKK